MLLKIENETGLAKDANSGGVVETNVSNYMDFMAVYYQKKQEIESKDLAINSRINSIENELSEVKGLLHQLLEKLNGNT